MGTASQYSLFDAGGLTDSQEAEIGRTRMRAMIDRLKTADEGWWKDQMAVILDDGAFKRAMALVPKEEAESLWAEYDAEMERHYAVWAIGRDPYGRKIEGGG